ncbi:hypothetical protein LIA77_08307 [Sarocladium implicatum]|nr:hypothetical protein LIA77_08307 [Sarocladium implicatum]
MGSNDNNRNNNQRFQRPFDHCKENILSVKLGNCALAVDRHGESQCGTRRSAQGNRTRRKIRQGSRKVDSTKQEWRHGLGIFGAPAIQSIANMEVWATRYRGNETASSLARNVTVTMHR